MRKLVLIAGLIAGLANAANAACVFDAEQAYMNCTGDGRTTPGADRAPAYAAPAGTDVRGRLTDFRTPDTIRTESRSEVVIRRERR